MRELIKAFLLVLAIMVLTATCTFAQNDAKNGLAKNTKLLFEKGDYKAALENLEAYLNSNKNDALILNLYARAYVGIGGIENRRKAIKHFKKSIKLDKSNLEFRNYYGELLLDMGDRWNAERTFKYIIKKDPEFIVAHSNLLKLYIKKKDTVKVLEFEKFISEMKTKGLGKEKMAVLNEMQKNLEDYKRLL